MAVLVRFTYWSGIGPLTSLKYSLALIGSQTMIVDGLEAHLDHFWEFAVFGRFCAIYVLEWNWPLNQFKVLFGFYWKPNHDF